MEDQSRDTLGGAQDAAPEASGAPVEPTEPVADQAVTPAEPVADQAVTPAEPAAAPAPEPAVEPAPAAAPAAADDKMTNKVTGTKSYAPAPAPDAAAPQQPGAAAPYAVGAAGAQQPGAGAVPPQQPASPYAQPAAPYGAQPGAPVPPASPYGAVPPAQAPAAGSGKATGALICGILAIVLCAAPIVGIVLGIVAIVMAGGYLKAFGPDGKAKAGRICGIVGIILSVLLWVFAIGTVLWAYNQVENAPRVGSTPSASLGSGSGSSSSSGSGSSGSSTNSVYDEDEQTILDLVSAQFDALEGGEAEMMQSVASIAAEGFEDATGVTMEECGIDPVNYARLMTDDLTYEVDLVVVNDKQGTGWVSVDVTCRDIFAVLDLFNEKVDEYDASGAANGMTEEQVNQKLGELLMAAVEETTETQDDYATINCTLENGTWVLNEDDWTQEMDYLFGLV